MKTCSSARQRVLSALLVVLVSALAACGSPQFHAIGYGWPIQCGTINELYATRTSEGYSAAELGSVARETHATFAVSESALATGLEELLDNAPDEIERRFEALEVPGADTNGDIDLQFSVRSLHIVERHGEPAVDVRISSHGHIEVAWPGDVVTNSGFRLGAVFRLAVALETNDDGVRIVLDPENSDIDNFEFTPDDESAGTNLIGWTQTALVDVFDGPILAALGRRELLRIENVELGETRVVAEALALFADEDSGTLRMTWGTNLDVAAFESQSPSLGVSDVSVFVPAAVIGPLTRQRWLIRLVAPAIEQLEEVINEGGPAQIAANQETELPSGATLHIRFDDVEVTPDGVLVRASVATSEGQ